MTAHLTSTCIIAAMICTAAALALSPGSIRFRRIGRLFLAAGLVFQLCGLIARGWLGGVFLANPIMEAPYLLPACLTLLALIPRPVDRRQAVLTALAALALAFLLFFPRGMIPPTPRKTTILAALFFLTEGAAYALFIAGAGLAGLQLAQRKATGFHSFVVWGFVVFSASQIIGAMWSFQGWGVTFMWGPRHLSTAAIWVIYAAYLHLRFLPRWSEKKRALFALAAALLVILVSYGHSLHEMNFPRIGG